MPELPADKSPYGYRWQKARKAYLAEHPVCVWCLQSGLVVAAFAVDHIEPHRGDYALFWDKANWQALCKTCHASCKQRLERSGVLVGCTAAGLPVDPNHHWNRPMGAPAPSKPMLRPANTGLSIEAYNRVYPLGLRRSVPHLTIVCGPSCSGKSRYVAEHMQPDDVVICLDSIAARLAGCQEHRHPQSVVASAFVERNRQLRALASTKAKRAWFIVQAPRLTERNYWFDVLGARSIVLLNPGADECVRRLRADPSRVGLEHVMTAWIHQWHRAFTQ